MTIAEHAAILAAIEAGDAALAEAAALTHVTAVEHWMRSVINPPRKAGMVKHTRLAPVASCQDAA